MRYNPEGQIRMVEKYINQLRPEVLNLFKDESISIC